MTPQQIKDNAPEGATKYVNTGVEILYLNDRLERWSDFYKKWVPVVLQHESPYIKPL